VAQNMDQWEGGLANTANNLRVP